MSGSTRRLIALGFVAGVATVSLGVAAYAAGVGQSLATAAPAAQSTAQPLAQPTRTPVATPAPTSVATPAPTPVVAAFDEAAADDDSSADTNDSASDVQPADGNVVEVRTPNPDAVPNTPAEYAYFYGLITECMSAAGYDWQGNWLSSEGTFYRGDMTQVGDVEPDRQAGFTLALDGDTGTGDYYHWADAGCWGNAVHVTGNDGNN